MSYLDSLNEVQRKAVIHTNGPVMVIAGPGSGKTRVLTYRIAYLIEQGVIPQHILALTFTNKAAREMKERIASVVGPKGDRVWAGTFHSIFARILRQEATKIGYPPTFTIYDRDDSKNLVADIIREMRLDSKQYNASGVLARISSAKSNLITPKMYAKDDDLVLYDRMNKRPMIYEIYERYYLRCTQAGAMDFDDLLLQMFRLLDENTDHVREKYQRIFQYLMVDEFQDTNYLQYAIIKLLSLYKGSAHNICIVGDDAQSIYSFRGATIENILKFEKDFPEVIVYKLEQNYRSTEHIVQAANKVIQNNNKQIPKEIWTHLGVGQRIKLIKAVSDVEEGRLIASSIVELKNRNHLEHKDIAILYRTNAQSRVFEEQLRKQNLPYRIFGGLSFYQRKEVKDILAYLRLSINERDDEALKRIINYPKRGIGKTTVDQLAARAVAEGVSMWTILKSSEQASKGKLYAFIQMIEKFRKNAIEANAYDAALLVARESGVYEELRQDTSIEGISRLENATALLDGIKEFVENDIVDYTDYADLEDSPDNRNYIDAVNAKELDRSLAAYLTNIALLTDMDTKTEELPDYISLMTTHTAKGLEWKSVFVVGMEENLFPSYLSMGSPDQLDEERRLFYVSITRAKLFLTLSYAGSRYQFGQFRYNDPSRFLDEIDQQHFETIVERRGKTTLPEPKLLMDRPARKRDFEPRISPADFKASPTEQIAEGMEVLHLQFGKGKIVAIDGARENRVATIQFEEGDDNERRIMLRFAKLQIVENSE
ncbi:MAG TPA: UvrD-helicase domain-containing protein [Saprospiraceae bacterium]|nr:UvrD-helicase domain-containing protein [Saprospiraceae bacterium]